MKKNSAFINMHKFFVLILGVFTLNAATANAQQVITIQQAVDSTLKNNLQVRQAQLTTNLTSEQLLQSKNSLIPTLNANTNPSLNFGRGLDQNTFEVVNQTSFFFNASVSSNVDVFNGFSKLNTIKQNKILLEADQTNVNKVKNDLIIQVVTAYLQVLFNTDLLRASQEQLTVANQTLKREEELISVGDKTLADLSQAKSQVATAELNVTNAANALEISYLTLGQLMERQPTEPFLVQAPLYNDVAGISSKVNPNEVFQSALATFPDVGLFSLRTQAAKKGIEIAKANFYPSIGLGASMSSSYSYQFGYDAVNPVTGLPIRQSSFEKQFGDRFGQGIGMSIRIPIFNGFNARSNVRQAKIRYENAQVSEQLNKNNLQKVIYQATADLKAAESRFTSNTNTFLASKDAFFVIEERYNVGLVNSLDYSTARTNMNKAETDMIQAKYDLIFRAKVIDYYLGKQITF